MIQSAHQPGRDESPYRANIFEEAREQTIYGNTIHPPAAASTTPNYTGPFITVAVLFFIFGFITNLNMALVPHLRSIFDLPYAWAMLAESAFFLAYFVFSSPTSKLIETIGYKRTMVVSLFIQVVGCLLFVPAAKMVSFPLFLTAVFIVGAGVTAADRSESLCCDSGAGTQRAGSADPGAGLELGRRHDCSAGCGRLHSDRSGEHGHKAAVANTVRGPYIAIAAGLLILASRLRSCICLTFRRRRSSGRRRKAIRF